MLFEKMTVDKGRVVAKDAPVDMDEITVKLQDPDGSLIKFLKALALHANPGHSFSVVMDPEGDDTEKFGFDGDGSFFIKEINGSKDFKDAKASDDPMLYYNGYYIDLNRTAQGYAVSLDGKEVCKAPTVERAKEMIDKTLGG